jgi:hypothetical protein
MVQLGIFRLLVLIVLVLIVFTTIYAASKEKQNVMFISGIWTLLIISIHTKRQDKIFLRINIEFDKLICSTEYSLLSIPIIVCLLIHSQWLPFIGIVFVTLFLGFVKINMRQQKKTLNTCLQQYIPFGMYEWKSGVRQYFYPLIVAWLLGLCTSFFVVGVPVAIFIIGILIIDFYKENESWQMLFSYQKNTTNILYYKIKQHLMFYVITNLPLFILFTIFHFELWYIPAIEFIILLSIHIYVIVLKYSFYSYDRNMVNPAFMIIGIFIGLIPLTTPLLWLFSIYLFLKARTNLYPYLYDYN